MHAYNFFSTIIPFRSCETSSISSINQIKLLYSFHKGSFPLSAKFYLRNCFPWEFNTEVSFRTSVGHSQKLKQLITVAKFVHDNNSFEKKYIYLCTDLCVPTSFSAVLCEILPITVFEATQVIKLRNGHQVLGKLHQLPITITVSMSLPEWFDCQTILRIHHKISSKIIKHDGV